MRLLFFGLLVLSPGCSCGEVHERDDAGTDAPAIDGGTDAARPDAPPVDAGPICELGAPTSDVAGTTPLGPISFPYAWAGLGHTSKACFGVALHATDVPALYGPPARSLWMWLPRPSAEPIVGVHTGVTVMLELDGETAMTATGVVEVTAYTREPLSPAVEATIDASGDGFDVHGTIAVPYCDVFADPCI
jgi:hypothetical protein